MDTEILSLKFLQRDREFCLKQLESRIADKAQCTIQIAEPWYGITETEIPHNYNSNVQSTIPEYEEMIGKRPGIKGVHNCRTRARNLHFRMGVTVAFSKSRIYLSQFFPVWV